jgi:hypothetical protein
MSLYYYAQVKEMTLTYGVLYFCTVTLCDFGMDFSLHDLFVESKNFIG